MKAGTKDDFDDVAPGGERVEQLPHPPGAGECDADHQPSNNLMHGESTTSLCRRLLGAGRRTERIRRSILSDA